MAKPSLAPMFLLIMILLVPLVVGNPAAVAADDDADTTAQDPLAGLRGLVRYYTQGVLHERAGELAKARDAYRHGADLVPGSPHLLLAIARSSAKLNDVGGCVQALEDYEALGATYDLSAEPAFAELVNNPAFADLIQRLHANGTPGEPSPVVVEFQDPQLWNEGIACDLQTGDLYAGSVKQSRIVRVHGDRQEDLGTSADDGLLEVLGLDVDEARRHLWAVTGRDDAEPGAPHDFGEAPRRNAVVVYDLDSGQQIQSHELADDGRIHLLNDVSVAPDGTAYITDMKTAEIYHVRPGHGCELYVALTDVNHINGLAVSDDGERLYVVGVEGMRVVDLSSGERRWLTGDRPLCLGLGDGMAVAGRDLFIVQNNGLLNMRVLHCRLDDTGYKVTASAALPYGLPDGVMPYTCAVGDGVLYINGTAPFTQYDAAEAPPASVIVAAPYE